MSLTKAERDALAADDFAVPGKRVLPIHDEKHVRMAWSQLDRTGGLSDEERAEARHRIMARAVKLGMDTSDWSTIKAMTFDPIALDAMSLEVPKVEGHPNRMPFSGVLTRIDQPSDAPPHGSNGRRVLLTHGAAEAALPGLLGMAVDFTPEFDGHDAKRKIGIITAATIQGDAIHIEGLLWASDFPDATARIQAIKNTLGFSYEMKNVHVADPGADTLVIESCDFTGAAILKKADAAYHTTSLAASKDRHKEPIDMTAEELKAALDAALAPIKTDIDALKASTVGTTTDLAASKEAQAKVAPHADAMRACAASMQAAGVGGHPTAGHVVRLNKMADSMEAEAAMGRIPHIYRDHDFLVDAGKDAGKEVPATDPTVAELKASIAGLTTVVTDLKTKAFNASAEPERKTLSPDVQRLIAKNGIEAGSDTKLTVAQFDEFLKKAGKTGTEAITLKLEAREAGVLAAA